MENNHPAWLFDESKQIGVDYTDNAIATEYDKQHESFRDFRKEAESIFAALNLSADSIVLDIGCGTGGLSIHFAQMCQHVYSVDVSGEMIAVLKQKMQRDGIKNIIPVQSGFLTYDHQGDPPDAIIASVTLHHLPDFWKQIALCRLFDFLKPGGKLFLADVVFNFAPQAYKEQITSWLKRMEEIAGKSMADETVTHVRDEFSTWDWIIKGMLERAGFTIEKSFEIMTHTHAYVCSKQ